MFPNKIYPKQINENDKKFIEGINSIKNNHFINNIFVDNYNKLWKIKNNNTTIYIYLKDDIHIWIDTIRIMLWRINFMRKYSKNNKYLEIWIFPLENKKIIPNNKILTVDNVNSGSTTYYNNTDNGIIHLWRKEEILKVLLHEIIHAFNLDKDHPQPNEAYTELKACIINIYLELLERQIPLTEVNKYIEYEKQFSLQQIKKVNKCINKNTNIHHYINKKSDLLYKYFTTNHNVNIIKNNNNSLRFTITELLLNKKKRDFNGKILNVI